MKMIVMMRKLNFLLRVLKKARCTSHVTNKKSNSSS